MGFSTAMGALLSRCVYLGAGKDRDYSGSEDEFVRWGIRVAVIPGAALATGTGVGVGTEDENQGVGAVGVILLGRG